MSHKCGICQPPHCQELTHPTTFANCWCGDVGYGYQVNYYQTLYQSSKLIVFDILCEWISELAFLSLDLKGGANFIINLGNHYLLLVFRPTNEGMKHLFILIDVPCAGKGLMLFVPLNILSYDFCEPLSWASGWFWCEISPVLVGLITEGRVYSGLNCHDRCLYLWPRLFRFYVSIKKMEKATKWLADAHVTAAEELFQHHGQRSVLWSYWNRGGGGGGWQADSTCHSQPVCFPCL